MFREHEKSVSTYTGVEREGLRPASQYDLKRALSSATEFDG